MIIMYLFIFYYDYYLFIYILFELLCICLYFILKKHQDSKNIFIEFLPYLPYGYWS